MDLSKKRLVKTGVRLFGIAFGLAVAMFLFSSVAFGHAKTTTHAATPAVAHVAATATAAHHATDDWGGGFGNFNRGFGNFNRFDGCFGGCGFSHFRSFGCNNFCNFGCRSFCNFGCHSRWGGGGWDW